MDMDPSKDIIRTPFDLSSRVNLTPEGKFFLADAGYAARPGILPPYRGVRYHLNEFAGSRDPTTPQELFNHRHSSLRTTVERAFAALKSRFKILTQRPFIPLKSQIKVLVACCALHNWMLENGPDEYVVDEATWYANLPRSNGRVRDREADIREWAAKRDLLAQQMWKDKESSQDTNLQIMGKHKLAVKSEEDCNSRDKYITSTDETTKFMLDWFFHELEELFSDQSQADGSLAIDQTTVNVDDGNDDNEDVVEHESYPIPVDSDEADSDIIGHLSPKVELDGNPLNKKRKRVTSSPSKNPTKGKANNKGKVSNDDIAASIKKLADSLASPIIPVQPMPPLDPYANLWKRTNSLTITAKDKFEIATHLSKPDQDVFRSYLNYADDAVLQQWVISYFETKFHNVGHDGGSAAAH
ncbi:hypothetical protein ACQ4PT_026099 [Festuca glaucescens]